MSYAQWKVVADTYEAEKVGLVKKHPGMYLLIHVPSGRRVIGNPRLDDQGGHKDAFKRFWSEHGSTYGLYFGVLIPKSL